MNSSKTVVGVDIAKRVFQLHWVDKQTGEMVSIQLKREKFLEHFAQRSPCLIGMEACGGAQHWARQLQRFGHEVKLLPAECNRAFWRGTGMRAEGVGSGDHRPSTEPVLSLGKDSGERQNT